MPKKILIVDDCSDSLEILRERLSDDGYDVIVASDGEQGLEETKKQKPDLVILDALLPKVDGFKVCEKIKKAKELKSIPVIMFTAVYVDEIDKDKAVQLGTDKYLIKPDKFMNKPFVPQELLENVNILLKERNPEESVMAKQKILVVDDDPGFLELTKDRLEKEGYLIYTAGDGREALDIVAKKDLDLILLDIQLPQSDGIQVLAKIKEKYPHISVVMVTAHASQELAVEAMRKGADDFITKPTVHKHFLIRVKKNLENSKLRRQKHHLVSILKDSNIKLMKKYEDLEKAHIKLNELKDQLAHSEKLSAVGKLATGVAHEINNPLCAIAGEAKILLKDESKDRDTKDASKVILEQAERIETITGRLLEFSHKRKFQQKPLDVNDVAEKAISLLSYHIRTEDIKIIKKLTPNLAKVLGDKNQLHEVFLNIMLNAVQAMEKEEKLTITIRTEKIIKYGRRKTDIFKQGQEIIFIEFKDTGKGMDEETLKKVFDPFFTTKEKNTGLGLSICYGIIKNHGGTIEVQSKLGKGSTFIVKLPSMEEGK